MRRVVVTGIGIVSSIGNNTQRRCWPSLHEGRSGVSRAAKIRRARISLPGAKRADPEGRTRRSTAARCRFLGGLAPRGTMSRWSRRSAIVGLEANEISNDPHRPDHGLGQPFDPHDRSDQRPTSRAQGRPETRRSRSAVPKAMSSSASATLSTWFKIKGVNYSISSFGLRDFQPLHRQCAYETDPMGQAGHRLPPAAARISTGPCRYCSTQWARCRPASTTSRPSPPAPMTRTATVLSFPAAPASSCWRNWSMRAPGARGSMARSPAMARHPTATTWSPPQAKARCAACVWLSPA